MSKSNGACNKKCADGSKCSRPAGWGMSNGNSGPCKAHAGKKKTGRPPKEIDIELLQELSLIHCTMTEMSHILGIDESNLWRRFASDIEKWRDEGRRSLRRAQFAMAMGSDRGAATMLIWLGKQQLEQKDVSRHEQTGKDGGPIQTVHKSEDQIRQEILGQLGIAKEQEVRH